MLGAGSGAGHGRGLDGRANDHADARDMEGQVAVGPQYHWDQRRHPAIDRIDEPPDDPGRDRERPGDDKAGEEVSTQPRAGPAGLCRDEQGAGFRRALAWSEIGHQAGAGPSFCRAATWLRR